MLIKTTQFSNSDQCVALHEVEVPLKYNIRFNKFALFSSRFVFMQVDERERSAFGGLKTPSSRC